MKRNRIKNNETFGLITATFTFLIFTTSCGARQTHNPRSEEKQQENSSVFTKKKKALQSKSISENGDKVEREKKIKEKASFQSKSADRFGKIRKNESIQDALKRMAGKWVKIASGTFWMGSPINEVGRFKHETRRRVTLTNSFMMKATEVTKREFAGVMGYDPSYYKRNRKERPVNEVTWHEAAKYCNRISELVGIKKCYVCSGNGRKVKCEQNTEYDSIYDCPGVRLPTEAEWEYAVRAGTNTATYNGNLRKDLLEIKKDNPVLDSIAWHAGNAMFLFEVGGKKPNAWGLYDMLGNVHEWCNDWFRTKLPSKPAKNPEGPRKGKMKVFRGGSFVAYPRYVRAAARDAIEPEIGSKFKGFRIVIKFSTVVHTKNSSRIKTEGEVEEKAHRNKSR